MFVEGKLYLVGNGDQNSTMPQDVLLLKKRNLFRLYEIHKKELKNKYIIYIYESRLLERLSLHQHIIQTSMSWEQQSYP